MPARPGWQPTPAQESLLQACLLQGPGAERALKRWEEQASEQPLDQGSERLLPLLWQRWGQRIASTEVGRKARWCHRRTWRDNQLQLARARPLVQALNRAAIPVMTIKGFALSLEAYRHLGVRPMADLDLVVPFQHVPRALEALEGEGWRASPTPLGGTGTELATHAPWLQQPRAAGAFDAAYLRTRHGHGFRKDGDLEVDLHWFLFQGQCDPGTDDGAWQVAHPVGEPDRWGLVGPGAALVLPAAADHLLLLLSHGARWNPIPPIRWVADAVTLVQSAPGLNWERFFSEAQRRRAVLPAREMLAYLRDTFKLPVPGTVLARLQECPVDRRERRSHRRTVAPPGARTALAELRYLGRRHRLLRRDPTVGRSVPSFGGYLCHVLGAPDLPALAGYGRRELLRRWRAPEPATDPSGPAP